MRHFLSGLALTAVLVTGTSLGPGGTASAQNPFEPVIYINDSAVTGFEVDQRVRFMRLLGAPQTTAAEAEKALVEDRLRMHAARLTGVEVSEEELQTGLDEFAGRAGLGSAEFVAALERAGIEHQVFRDFVAAGVAWRGVIGRRVVPQLNVTDAEVDQELRRQIETPIITRVLISELIIPAPDGQEEAALARATSIAQSNPATSQFAAAARQYSAAPSAESGGQLEWLNIDNLPPSLRPILLSLQPGQTSQPLTIPGAVVLFHLRDTQGTLRPGAREQVLEYMTLRMTSAADAAALAARTRHCDDLYVQAGPDAAAQILRQTAAQNAIPTLIATQLASLDPDEAAVINNGTSADLVMLCARQPALLANAGNAEATGPDALPDREAARNELFNRKANAAADAYLAELRADAVIRRP